MEQVQRSGQCPDGPRHVAIVTAHRPRAVRRSVSALLKMNAQTRASTSVHVFDNGTVPRCSADVEAICQHVATTSGSAVTYVGASGREALARALIEGGCDADLISFAVAPSTAPAIGANRNALLLYLAGEPLVSLDDDVVPRLMEHESCAPGVELAGRRCPQRILFGHADELSRTFRPCHDAIGEPHRCLGRRLEDVLATALGAARTRESGTRVIVSPSVVPGKRVRVTVNGFIGYDVSAASTYLLFTQGDTRVALLETEQAYRQACADGWTSRFVSKAALTLDVSCITTCCGIDNAELVPPFFPSFRGEDTLWAATLASCDSSAAALYLPETVYHFPIDLKVRRRIEPHCHQRPLLLNVLEAAMTRLGPTGSTVPANLQALGRTLVDWTGASVNGFRHVWVEMWQRLCRSRLEQIDLFRSLYGGSPQYWDRDMVALAREIRLALTCADNGFPRDLVGLQAGSAEGWCALREVVRQFGRLLQHWPVMWQTARALRGVPASTREGLHVC